MISNSVKFLLNDKILEIKNPDPNQTILNYIRTELKKTGTKEGCSEGGCGACTIVLGELINNKIKYNSINSCISFVPSLNGKQLLIVEDLVSKDGKLHPVQDAMVRFHGSQCGFCTPGFVMSLFSMFKNNKSFNNELITESISGNLCRCTGYRPIIDAAKSLNKINRKDEFSKNENKIIKLLKKIKSKNIYIKKDDKVYFSPKNIKDLKNIIKKNSNFNFLAGGTDLSLKVTKERKDILSIIDLKEIKELNFIKVNKNYMEIGAATPLIKFEDEIKKYYPDFYSVLKRYGSVQIRNVGTIGGNIATASPIGDTLPILLSLKAEVLIESFNQKKVLPINNFFIDYRKTKLKKNEFIRSIKIPLFKKIFLKHLRYQKGLMMISRLFVDLLILKLIKIKLKRHLLLLVGWRLFQKELKPVRKFLKISPLQSILLIKPKII